MGVPRFRYLLDDLSNIDDAFLLARPLTAEARVSFLFLSLIPGYADPDVVLVRWDHTLSTIGPQPNSPDVLAALATYIRNISNESGRERMCDVMTTLAPEVSQGFASIADVLHAEGREEGRAEGQAELFTHLMNLRFGPLSPDISTAVTAASPDQINAWSAQLIEGTLTLREMAG